MIAFEKRSVIKIFYYLMSVDGQVTMDEMRCFEEVGSELDPEAFSSYQDEVVAECERQIASVFDSEEFYDVISEGVDEVLFGHRTDADNGITPTHLVWNLLVIAFSNGVYDLAEKRLIRHIVRVMKLNRTIYMELEEYMKTNDALNQQLQQLEKSNLPYNEVCLMVSELQNRQSVIGQCVQALIMDERYQPIEKITVQNTIAEGVKNFSEKAAPVASELGKKTGEFLGSAKDKLETNGIPGAINLGKQAKSIFGGFRRGK